MSDLIAIATVAVPTAGAMFWMTMQAARAA